MSGKIRIATAQFNVSGDVKANFEKISNQIKYASERKADVIHFSECCLSGYPVIDLKECLNDPNINIYLSRISELAEEYAINVIVGTHYYEGDSTIPFNSVFVFDSSGKVICRYDKRILAGAPGQSDQAHYIAGDLPVTFELNHIKCGLIICHEWRYPELFREYKQLGVELVFHSFYDGNLKSRVYKDEGIELGELISGSERTNAANNYLWMSVSNTSQAEQVFPSSVIWPDGSYANKAVRNQEEVIITDVDTSESFIDPSKYGRKRIAELFPKGILK